MDTVCPAGNVQGRHAAAADAALIDGHGPTLAEFAERVRAAAADAALIDGHVAAKQTSSTAGGAAAADAALIDGHPSSPASPHPAAAPQRPTRP